MVNSAISIRQKLLNLAKERRENFDFVLKQFLIQRLLYRLSVSEFREQFLLKGAMLFWVWGVDTHRPTRDIDLLGYGSNDIDDLIKNFQRICAIETGDGLVFDLNSVSGIAIKEDALYQGVRITGGALLDKARITYQVDIGFGDAVTPAAEVASLPSFLAFPDPELRVYPVYTVIAEKFQAMVMLGIFNSRIKDFYDLWAIASELDVGIEGRALTDAVKATFECRGTVIDGMPLAIFGMDFAGDERKQQQWQAFLSKNGLQSKMVFAELMDKLRKFLKPVYAAVAKQESFKKNWSSENWSWIGKSTSALDPSSTVL